MKIKNTKTKVFPETTSLWLSNNTNLIEDRINHRILIKFIKKNIFGAKKIDFLRLKIGR